MGRMKEQKEIQGWEIETGEKRGEEKERGGETVRDGEKGGKRGEEKEKGGDMGRDRRAGGGGRSNKAINRDLGIGRQGPGLASLSTLRGGGGAIWLNSINSFRQEVPSTLGTLKCCLIRLAQISDLFRQEGEIHWTLDF